jgi:hypothetical protein
MIPVLWPIIGWMFLAMDLSNHHAKINWDRFRTVGSDLSDVFAVFICGLVLGPIAILIWAKHADE